MLAVKCKRKFCLVAADNFCFYSVDVLHIILKKVSLTCRDVNQLQKRVHVAGVKWIVVLYECVFWRSRGDTEQHGVPQSAGERWMVISCLKSRSTIKWPRLAHFNQTGWIGWYRAVSHPVLSPNPYFTKLGYLCQRVLCGFIMSFLFLFPDVL